MKIGFEIEQGARVDVTVKDGAKTYRAQADSWRESHIVATATGGRVNVLPVRPEGLTKGRVVARPDGTTTLDLSGEMAPGDLTWRAPDGRMGKVKVTPCDQRLGWGRGEHYMLPVDQSGAVVPEPGRNHRKVFISVRPGAFGVAEIAADAGVAESVVKGPWLATTGAKYGASEAYPITPAVSMLLWTQLGGERIAPGSHWWLYERGYTYDVEIPASGGKQPVALIPAGRGLQGESPLHPMLFGAWGSGSRPKIVGRQYQVYDANFRWLCYQDIHFSLPTKIDGGIGVLLDGVETSRHELALEDADRVTLRRARMLDNTYLSPSPRAIYNDLVWEASNNRMQALYTSDVNGLLMEEIFVDHAGWGDGYDAVKLDALLPQPPSMYSHNIYLQFNTYDATFRDSITSRAASYGVQMRAGGTLENVLLLDNNCSMNMVGGDYKHQGFTGEFGTVRDCVTVSAAYRDSAGMVDVYARDGTRVLDSKGAPVTINGAPSALNWGMYTQGRGMSLIGNIVAHRADPANAAEVQAKPSSHLAYWDEPHAPLLFNDTKVWRWNTKDERVDGLSAATLDATTIQKYADQVMGAPGQTIGSFITWLRAQPEPVSAHLNGIMRFFRQGFGIDRAPRTQAATARFVPDPRGEGRRWDNRTNWTTNDLPGTLAGDKVDLGGNTVLFGGKTLSVAELSSGGGRLAVVSGKLTVGKITDTAQVSLSLSGQLWVGAAPQALDVRMTNGRLALTGAAAAASIEAGGQAEVLLGPDCTIPAGSRLTVAGALARVGWDGTGAKSLKVRGTLDLRASCVIQVSTGESRFLQAGQEIVGPDGRWSATIVDFVWTSIYLPPQTLYVTNLRGIPQAGDRVTYHTRYLASDARPAINGVPQIETRPLTFDVVGVLPATMPVIEPYRSGAFGLTQPAVTPTVDLTGAQITLDVTRMQETQAPITLVRAAITGAPASVTCTGLAPTLDATVTVTGSGVTLTLAAGTGQSSLV